MKKTIKQISRSNKVSVPAVFNLQIKINDLIKAWQNKELCVETINNFKEQMYPLFDEMAGLKHSLKNNDAVGYGEIMDCIANIKRNITKASQNLQTELAVELDYENEIKEKRDVTYKICRRLINWYNEDLDVINRECNDILGRNANIDELLQLNCDLKSKIKFVVDSAIKRGIPQYKADPEIKTFFYPYKMRDTYTTDEIWIIRAFLTLLDYKTNQIDFTYLDEDEVINYYQYQVASITGEEFKGFKIKEIADTPEIEEMKELNLIL